MGVKSVSLKVFYVLAVIVVAFAASLLWGGEQAHADGKPVARLYDSRGGLVGSYENLQDAFNVVGDYQTVRLISDIETNKEFMINRGTNKEFYLDLNGHTITRSNYAYGGSYILHIVNSRVRITDAYGSGKGGGLIGKTAASCIRIDSGRLDIWPYSANMTKFQGYRVAVVNGGELNIDCGTFENSIVVNNPESRIIINAGSSKDTPIWCAHCARPAARPTRACCAARGPRRNPAPPPNQRRLREAA